MHIMAEKTDGTIGFGCDITDVIFPYQVIANGDNYIVVVLCYF